MNHLMRELAPVTDGAWTQIDEEAARSLKLFLAARRLVDFAGPLGWDYSAVATGRIERGRRHAARLRGISPTPGAPTGRTPVTVHPRP